MPLSFSLFDLVRMLKSAKFREIDAASWNGQPAQVEACKISFEVLQGRVTIDAKLAKDGATCQVQATHALDDSFNEVKIDGADVEKDDVDLDLDTHFGWAALEYRLEYTQNGEPQKIVLVAKERWF